MSVGAATSVQGTAHNANACPTAAFVGGTINSHVMRAAVGVTDKTVNVVAPITDDGGGVFSTWTKVADWTHTSGRTRVYEKVVSTGDVGAAYTFKLGAGQSADIAVYISRRTGMDILTPIGAVTKLPDQAGSLTFALPDVTTQLAGDAVEHIIGAAISAQTLPSWVTPMANVVALGPNFPPYSILLDIGEHRPIAAAGLVSDGSVTAPSGSVSAYGTASLTLRIAGSNGGGLPYNSGIPTITGTPKVGTQLTANAGAWNGTPAGTTTTYVWRRNGIPIAGATLQTYTPVQADLDAGAGALSVTVTQTLTGGGSGEASSQGVTVATGDSPPVNTTPPSISGTLAINQTLSRLAGTWSGSPTPTIAVNWQQSSTDPALPAGPTAMPGQPGLDIPGATGDTFLTRAQDAGTWFRIRATATNTVGTATAFSAWVAIPPPPAVVGGQLPAITPAGPYNSGEVIHGVHGVYSNADSIASQWYSTLSHVPITGEVTQDYEILRGDEGHHLAYGETVTGPGGTLGPIFSADILVQQSTPISEANILLRYSGGVNNANPAASIGGPMGAFVQAATVESMFGKISGSEARLGVDKFIVLYVANTHTTDPDPATVLRVAQQPLVGGQSTGLVIEVGVPVETANEDVAPLDSILARPVGIAFTSESDPTLSPAVFGDLPPLGHRGFYVHLHVPANTGKIDEANAARFFIGVYSGGT